MWRKNKWTKVIVLALTLVLLAGVLSGVVYAQTGSTQTSDPGKTLMARVATILGIDQKKLEDAFAQAQKQMQDEELANQLKTMVSQGTITQQQADQYKQWWGSRPNIPGLDSRGGGGFPGGPRGMPGPGANPPPTTTTPKSG